MEWENWQLWIAAALVLLICEVFVPGFVLACLGVGAFGGALAASLGAGFALQLTVTAATSLIAFVFLRPLGLAVWILRTRNSNGRRSSHRQESPCHQGVRSSNGTRTL